MHSKPVTRLPVVPCLCPRNHRSNAVEHNLHLQTVGVLSFVQLAGCPAGFKVICRETIESYKARSHNPIQIQCHMLPQSPLHAYIHVLTLASITLADTHRLLCALHTLSYPVGTPSFVPWQDHEAEPKFICDVMTEGLAKQLRLYGVDAAAVESKGKHARHLVYRSSFGLLRLPKLGSCLFTCLGFDSLSPISLCIHFLSCICLDCLHRGH